MKVQLIFLMLVVSTLFLSCAGNPVSSYSSPGGMGEFTQPAQPITYVVKRGDTLRNIAQRYNVNFLELASWNSLFPPYTIHPRQELVVYQNIPTIGINRFNDCGVQIVSVNTFSHRCGVFSLSKKCTGAYYVIKNASPITKTITVKYRQKTLHENATIPANSLIDGSEYNVADTIAPQDIVISECY
jgi:LysM repeat protein